MARMMTLDQRTIVFTALRRPRQSSMNCQVSENKGIMWIYGAVDLPQIAARIGFPCFWIRFWQSLARFALS